VRILTVNAGSSSLKLRVIDDADTVTASYDLMTSYDVLATQLPPVDVVAHRVVHGGVEFREPVRIDTGVEDRLRALTELAPLHQPKSLAAMDAVRAALPDVPHLACFDTAFHATIPAAAATYALPQDWTARYQIRRYGFHGLSHAWAARRAAAMVPDARRVVTCHLGAGASLCAVLDGQSVDTTMGFTPVDGLVMATRCGSVDPGLVLWLAEREADVADALENRSGLLGLSGSADMSEVLRRDDPAAQLALEVYLHHLRAGIATMAAALGGLDACVFTGGVGENAAAIRERAIDGLGFLGLGVDASRNAITQSDADVTAEGAMARVLVVASREDLEMAHLTRALLRKTRR
jgi:acetate kinase